MFPAMIHKVVTCADGAAVTNVELGFVPDWVIVRNRNAADTEIMEWEWGKAMGDGKGWKVTKTATSHADDTQWVASGGDISELDTRTIQTTDPIQIIQKKGIIIAAAFHDTDDVIDIMAWKTDL